MATPKRIPYIIPLNKHQDERGMLGVVQDQDLPFDIKRVFWLDQVPPNTSRGGHAHHESQQVLICTHGTIKASLEDVEGQYYEFELKDSREALFIPAQVWGVYLFVDDARALALASNQFDERDYIQDYDIFKSIARD